jgi:carbamoyltransferase
MSGAKRILGLNSAGFNTSAALVIDGQLAFAVEEERLIREKRTRRFPIQGVRAALADAGLRFEDIDAVAVAWNPAVNLEAFNLPQSQRHRYLGEIFYNVPNYLMSLKSDNAASQAQQVIEFLDGSRLDITYVTHHLAHAATFFFSPFDRAAVLTVDAFGEKQSVLFAEGDGTRLQPLWSQEFPHSLGSFYSTMTEYLGFQPQSDEWKLMGASSYGDSNRFYDKVRSLFRLHDDGGFELDLSYFNHYQFHRPGLFTPKLVSHLNVCPNKRDAPLAAEHHDLAAAAQRVMEDVYFHMLNQLQARTGLDRVVIAGGVGFNSVANGKVTKRTPFRDVFVSPVPDDSGGSAGAAFYLYHHLHGQPRSYVMQSNYLGPGYSNQAIAETLDKFKVRHTVVPNPAAVAAKLIAEGKIVGWFQGRLEFGDRALGNRSILADPRDASMKDRVNETVKYREPFRPFAPSILLDRVDDYFVDAAPTPFMEKVFPVRPEKRAEIPAVTHVDGSGRLQTVSREQNALYFELISEFNRLTGTPVVLNTSFNLKGEAMVGSPQDALRTFYSSGLDALVLGNCLVEK